MKIFVQDNHGGARLPCTAAEVGAMLSTDLALLRKYGTTLPISFDVPTVISRDLVAYDPDRLSYPIILGIVLAHNRSIMRYVPLLVETLSTDYHIPVTCTDIPALSKDDCDFDLAELASAAKADGAITFADVRLLTDNEAQEIRDDDQTLVTPVERSSLALHFKFTLLGVAPERVDEPFYVKYVVEDKGNEFYHRVKRFRLMGQNSFEVNQRRATRVLDDILTGPDPNMALFKTRAKDHYGKLLVGHEVFGRIFDKGDLAILQRLEVVQVQEDHVLKELGAWLEQCTPAEHKSLKTRLDSKMRGHLPANYSTFKLMCEKVFGLVVGRKDPTHKKSPAYKELTVQNEELRDFVMTYAPTLPHV
jgi:hypothetical protein